MIDMDITLVIQIINMIILMFFLNKVLYKPVRGVLKKRSEKLQSMQGEISKYERNAQLRQEEVDAKMAKASGKAKAALDSARADAQSAGAEKLAAIKAEADAGKEKQMADIKSQIEGASKALQANLDGFATDMASKILGEESLMMGVKHLARSIVILTAALCFALSAGIVWASETGHDPAATVEHAKDAAGGHEVAVAHEAVGEHGAAPAEGGEHHGGSLSAAKLKDLGWRVMNFAVLVLILVKFGAKPIASGLSGRQKAIREEIETLEAKKAAAETSYKEFTAKLATVEKDIDTIVERAVAQAEIEKAKIIEKAEQAAEDIKRQADMAIQNSVTEARKNLKDEIADKAAVMAEDLIVKNLTEGDQVKIIEDYLNKVGAVQ